MTDQRHSDHGGNEGDAPSLAERPAAITGGAKASKRSSGLVIMGMVAIGVAGLVAMRVLPPVLPKGPAIPPMPPPRPVISIIPLSEDYLNLRSMLRRPLWPPFETPPPNPGGTTPAPPPVNRRPAIEVAARSLELELVIAGERPAAIISGHKVVIGQAFLMVRPQDQAPFEFRLKAVDGRSATIVADEVDPPVEIVLQVALPLTGREHK